MTRSFAFSARAALGLFLMAVATLARAQDFDAIEFKSTDLGSGVYMLQGYGGNLGVSVGPDGVFLIDDEFPALTPKLIAAIRKLTAEPIEFVINTHWHGDHVGGNQALGDLGTRIVAHDNVRTRMAAPGPDLSPAAALPVITFSDTTTFHYNGHEIHAFHPVNAHTDGDAVIHFRDLDIIHTGDLLFNGLYPFIDLESGGTIDGYIQGLSQLIELTGPETRIIPGHGPMATRKDVERAKAMLSDARSRVAMLIAQGKSLDDVKAIDPLSIYHSDWSWAFINGERMTETLYVGLKAPAESRKP